MTVAYPVYIKKSDDMYAVCVPDFDGFTQGKDFCDAMKMARDYIGGMIVGPKGDETNLPEPSSPEQAAEKMKRADDWYSDGTMTYIDVDVEAHRALVRNLSVKKNCTLPYWLEQMAEEAGVNFSQVLQEALKQKLEIA
ncbi:MAG: type II toxin-antitoxin system HicB family antitoxin [Lachnospiraceae bacterium]|nr:type II toxin-antitoxin system HicB family antitoxin [Lachnospiraceae bacterium]